MKLEINKILDKDKEYGCVIAGNPGFKFDQLVKINLVIDIISKTDEKLQFLIALFNTIKCLLNSKEQFNTPICFDATCSGFQHLAALFRDIELGVHSNITPKVEDNDGDVELAVHSDTSGEFFFENNDAIKMKEVIVPGDIYKEVADKLKKDIDKSEEIPSELRDKLLKIKIDRKLLKKPVMTIPYNVGLRTMGKQLINDGFFLKKSEITYLKKNVKDYLYFYVVSDKLIKDEYKNESLIFTRPKAQRAGRELNQFFYLLYESVYKTFPSLKKYVDFLNGFARIFSRFDIPIVWTTPTGMKIEMKYLKTRWVKGKNLYRKKPASSVLLPINIDTNINKDKLDKTANKIAFLPKFIHSMDSANIKKLVERLRCRKKGYKMNLFTIHDCFATTPDSMKDLNLEVKKTFSDIYFEQDYIKKMYKDFLTQLSSFTTIYKKIKNGKVKSVGYNELGRGLKDGEELFVIYGLDSGISEDSYFSDLTDSRFTVLKIPEIPYNIKNSHVIKIFKQGIKNSLYFIN